MRVIGLLLKYGPWRDALRKSFNAVLRQRSGCPVVRSLRSRAELCLEVLRTLCLSMDGVVSEAWIDNVGYRVGFCSGPVPFLTGIGVIKRASATSHGLKFNKGNEVKNLCRAANETEAALRKLQKLIAFADVVSQRSAPRTCQEWIDGFNNLLFVLSCKHSRCLIST